MNKNARQALSARIFNALKIQMDPSYFRAQSEIQRELDSGEKLLWSGQPRQGLRLNISDAFAIPFSTGLVRLCHLLGNQLSSKEHAPLLFKLWGVPFVVAGLYLVFVRFFADAYMRARTFYGVTDKRLIIVTGSFSRRVRSLAWQSLPEATLTKRGNNGGVINFGPRLPFGLPQSDNIGGLLRSGQSLTPALDYNLTALAKRMMPSSARNRR